MLLNSFVYGVCPFSLLSNDLIPCKASERLPKGSKSVIVVLFPYNLGEDTYKGRNISRYAVPKDYHIICMDYLDRIINELKDEYPNDEFSAFCDNSPINEVKAAALSGLGVVGENGVIINNDYGSWVFIGEIVTTAVLEYSVTEIKRCVLCGACEKSCPTNAICNGKKDRSKCLSAITQQKGEIADEFKNIIRQTKIIWGCDICQEVCPMNKDAKTTDIEEFKEDIITVLKSDTPIENRAFSWRGEKVVLRNLDILL